MAYTTEKEVLSLIGDPGGEHFLSELAVAQWDDMTCEIAISGKRHLKIEQQLLVAKPSGFRTHDREGCPGKFLQEWTCTRRWMWSREP